MKRFWDKVDVGGLNDCWPWKAGTKRGYGQYRWRGHKERYAHRIALGLRLGRPVRRQALHACDNRACCNPAHLYEGTHADNMRDKAVAERVNTTKLTASKVLDIREQARAGASQRVLAKRYGVAPTTIHNAVRGVTWKHLE